jgi:hypothetical protein
LVMLAVGAEVTSAIKSVIRLLRSRQVPQNGFVALALIFLDSFIILRPSIDDVPVY